MKIIFLILVMVGFVSTANAQVGELPHYFSFDGYLLDSGDVPITGTVSVTFQVYNPDADCLLFEESHASVTPGTDGSFSVKVGGGTRTGNDPGVMWPTIFQNNTQVRSAGANCGTAYTPSLGHARKLRVKVGAITLSPDYTISSVPTATVAETLQGKVPGDFIASVPYTLPNTLGSANQFLQTNGAGATTWATPGGGGISSLNALTDAIQTFGTIGTSGTAPTWSSSASVHTLNIPLASSTSVTAGLISNIQFDDFNNKMSTPAGTADAVLRFDGTNWVTTSGLTVESDGDVAIANAPTSGAHAARKDYVDTAIVSSTFGTSQINDGAITDVKVANVGVDKISSGVGKYLTYAPNGTACMNNKLLKWDNTFGRWVCSDIDYVDSAGGTMTGGLVFDNYASSTAPSIALVQAGNGFYAPVANHIGVSTNSIERIRVTDTGNVGIGTTTPEAILHVVGGMKVGPTGGYAATKVFSALIANATCTFTSINSGAVGTCTATLPGAAISVSPTSKIALDCLPSTVPLYPEMLHSCHLSAADTVKIVVLNGSGASFTPPGQWNIILTKYTP